MKNMIKNKNTLIKYKPLRKELHNAGIKRINDEALLYLGEVITKDLIDKLDKLSKEIVIKGKKTLEIKDIKDLFEKLEKKEKTSWEI